MSTENPATEAEASASSAGAPRPPLSAEEATKKEAPNSATDLEGKGNSQSQDQDSLPHAKVLEDLPKNRFELELEFVQMLASPAYVHYLATNPSSDDHNWLDDPEFIEYLRYLLKTWSRPEYNRFLVYPNALYFLEWMLNHRREEWAQVAFRNFAHQQQFMSWQHRASRLYGRGSTKPQPMEDQEQQQQGPDQPADGPREEPQAMEE
jgi:mediator of RNA polymerase II transcription subunit 31